jgi:hypothetical protein
MKRLKAIFAASIMVGVLFTPATAANAIVVPKTTWAACDSNRVTYCVESVSIQAPGTINGQPLTWVPSGTSSNPTPAATPSATPSATPAATPAPTASADPAAPAGVTTTAGAAVAGRWTYPNWATDGKNLFGYDGILIDARTANMFTNHLFFDIRPIKVGAGDVTNVANDSATGKVASLNKDEVITFTIRVGEIVSGVTVAIGDSIKITKGTSSVTGGGNTLTVTGSPTPVALAAKLSDCTGESGKAIANSNQMQAIVITENDDMGFGVDGVSGNMYVASNGSCELSTPVWDEASKSMSWKVAAPHFAVDGTTVNQGFYKAVIPVNDALLLWGLANPKDAATALSVQVRNEDGGATAALSKVSVKNGNIIIDVSGFHYSKPTLKISRKATYKKFAKTTTLKCYNAKTKKTVTVKAFGCPAGTTKKK